MHDFAETTHSSKPIGGYVNSALNLRSFIAFCTLALSGCAILDQDIRADADKTAAFPLTERVEVERLDLAQLIDDEANLNCKMPPRSLSALEPDANPHFSGHRLDRALGCFNRAVLVNPALTRNQIQERMLAASEQRCADFKALLQRKQSNMSFVTGLATAVFAAAGSITTSVEGARTLAGLSGISSATNAEYNQAFFSNLASHVIVAGINLHRARIYEQIIAQGQIRPIDQYTLQGAIKDAFKYHAACSIMTGLNEAQQAIKTVENPGLGILQRVTIKNKFLQALNGAAPNEVPQVLEKWKDIAQSDTWLAGIPLTSMSVAKPPEPARLANIKNEIVANARIATAAFIDYANQIKIGRPSQVHADKSTTEIDAAIKKLAVLEKSLEKEVVACDKKVTTNATENIEFTVKLATEKDIKAKEKIAVDLKFLNAESDAIAAAMTTWAFEVTSCELNLRKATKDIKDAPNNDPQTVLAAIEKLSKKINDCKSNVDAFAACK